jgi:hypothetical protein
VDLQDEMLQWGAHFLKCGLIHKIVINGLTQNQCQEKKVNYFGYENWLRLLCERHQLDPNQIVLTEPAVHTYMEAVNLQMAAERHQWKKIGILSFPYHIARCLLTHLSVKKMRKTDIRWFECVEKQVLGGEILRKTRAEMLLEEWTRIEKYIQSGDCVSLEEGIEYLSKF